MTFALQAMSYHRGPSLRAANSCATKSGQIMNSLHSRRKVIDIDHLRCYRDNESHFDRRSQSKSNRPAAAITEGPAFIPGAGRARNAVTSCGATRETLIGRNRCGTPAGFRPIDQSATSLGSQKRRSADEFQTHEIAGVGGCRRIRAGAPGAGRRARDSREPIRLRHEGR